MIKKLLHLEDDFRQHEVIRLQLESLFKRNGLPVPTIERLSTECDFREALADITSAPPDVAIIDVMLKWCSHNPPPEDIRSEGVFRAGIRCQHLLSTNLPTVPVIFYSVLERKDLRQELEAIAKQNSRVSYLSKDSSVSQLFDKIRSLAS